MPRVSRQNPQRESGVKLPSAVPRLSGEDLSFWWFDSPMQPTTMAMLMVLDRSPDDAQLRLAFERAVAAVPRLAQRVADAPLDLTLPHWELDPTFDLDYHVRRHALSGAGDVAELFHEIAPAYEAPFDRSRPLWEVRVYDGLGRDHRAALFFKLHHAVADGVGGNAIFAAMSDWEREPSAPAKPEVDHRSKGGWPEPRPLGERVLDALRDRVELDFERASAVASTVVDTIQHPEKLSRALAAVRSMVETLRFDSHSPLKASAGRARHLSGTDLPFEAVRALRRALGGSMIDVILTIMARAIGRWHAAHHLSQVRELMTLVPVNLRKPEQWAEQANVGNVATGILLPLPIRMRSVLTTYREIHQRMEAKKADPLSTATPLLTEWMSVLPRSLVSWMAEASFGSVDFIVTNVPGILVPRYLAGAEILAAYPFAPVAMKSPVSVALYGYRDRLFIGLNSDETLMPDVDDFKAMIRDAFAELCAAAGVHAAAPAATSSRRSTRGPAASHEVAERRPAACIAARMPRSK
ncbi:MAG: wax ester/triacylglycerol synthase family O-acyltransferase [Deltaproteobacteria bacterium]|nr:wax ester/triacylglycerol synthase family O-acyltransferase [Deltaproteobacteria bacterium]MBI3386283.1 wax ester/triacylglycerol synthase family O-acyltransferase [Deltaproteobacteria bacterium]